MTAQYASSSNNTTPIVSPRDEAWMGAAVLLNRHVPSANETDTAIATTDNIRIFVDNAIPGTISRVAIKRRKRRVDVAAKIKYVQERIYSPRNPRYRSTASLDAVRTL